MISYFKCNNLFPTIKQNSRSTSPLGYKSTSKLICEITCSLHDFKRGKNEKKSFAFNKKGVFPFR